MAATVERRLIHITGVVQGVGFRPFVYGLAVKYKLRGWCLNDSSGVTIDIEGEVGGKGKGGDGAIADFLTELRSDPPPLARIEDIREEKLLPVPYDGFEIRESAGTVATSALISPDVSICDDCLGELLDPGDRRYLYPFINCTNCGPRYSIVTGIPYDRRTTTMAKFKMCAECESEYRDPANRRFHAEPTGCAECGPRVWLVEGGGEGVPDLSSELPTDSIINGEAIERARLLLKDGAIVAIKGLGGFHLACDATNNDAVNKLRQRKRRSNKPFALMARGVETVKEFCKVSVEEERLLTGTVSPIVILDRLESARLPDSVAPSKSTTGNSTLGFMLPYTPLHRLLFEGTTTKDSCAKVLIMTSGNVSDEPIVITNEEAVEKLFAVADHFLFHDRDIYMRVDDSIVTYRGLGRPRVLRRSRGYVPNTLRVLESSEDMPSILATGGELKNTLCLTRGNRAVLGQHMGDMENIEVLDFFKETLKNLKRTFHIIPDAVATDMHPDYLSTRYGEEYASSEGLGEGIGEGRVIPVQHHHAHIVSVMAEHGLTGEVLGVSFDGTGYGSDSTVWGGEFLLATRGGFERAAHLSQVPMPGGDRAVKEPWRMGLSHLFAAYGDEMWAALPGFFERVGRHKAETIFGMTREKINSPLTSSAGRLFDAVASLAGVRDEVTFEGEAAIELEMAAHLSAATRPYPFTILREGVNSSPLIIDTSPLVRAVVEDVRGGADAPYISARFHLAVCDMVVCIAEEMRRERAVDRVCLGGGVFQNSLLLSLTTKGLEASGFCVWTGEAVPVNDGGVALGQAAVALELLKNI